MPKTNTQTRWQALHLIDLKVYHHQVLKVHNFFLPCKTLPKSWKSTQSRPKVAGILQVRLNLNPGTSLQTNMKHILQYMVCCHTTKKRAQGIGCPPLKGDRVCCPISNRGFVNHVSAETTISLWCIRIERASRHVRYLKSSCSLSNCENKKHMHNSIRWLGNSK